MREPGCVRGRGSFCEQREVQGRRVGCAWGGSHVGHCNDCGNPGSGSHQAPRTLSFDSFLLQPRRKHCYQPHSADVVTETRGGTAACPRMSPGLSDSRAHSLHGGPFAAWCSRGVASPREPWSGTTQASEAGTPAFRCWPMALCPSHLATAEVSWALAWLVCRAQLFLPSACRVPGAQRCSNPPHLCPEARPAAGLPQGLKKDPYRLGSPQGPSFLPCFSLWPGDLLAGPAGCEGDPGCLGEGSSEQKPE